MKLELKVSNQPVEPEQEIIAGGEKIGILSVLRYSHGGETLKATISDSDILLQGYGDTPEDAVRNAIEKGKLEANRQLQFIAELEAKLS
jgi:hypothetical protein